MVYSYVKFGSCRRTIRARRRPGEATVERQLHAPGRLRYPLGQLTKPCNLTPLESLRDQPSANYSTWTVQTKKNGKRSVRGRRNGHPERPERPRAASGGGAEPSTCALSGREALLSQGKASRSHIKHLHTYRSEPFNRSRRKAVFEPV